MLTFRCRFLATALLLAGAFVLVADSQTTAVSFSVMAIARNGKDLFICGSGAGIASSSDGGRSWQSRNSNDRGGTLLAIGWKDDRLGYSGGTGGQILITTDGGATWTPLPTSFTEPILQLSFSDAEHGLVLTTAAVEYTNDGGKNWHAVLPSQDGEISRFKFVLEVAAADANHAAILLKEGPAQYFDGRILSTTDAGGTWKLKEIEHTTLNNLLVVNGEFWLVGTEVIDRQNHGGHAVGASFHSQDGISWEHGPKPLIDVNNACRSEGCLMWNGALSDPFVEHGTMRTFVPLENVGTQWAATQSRFCTVAGDITCEDLKPVDVLPERGAPAPHLSAFELRPAPSDPAGKCIRSDYPPVLISHDFNGRATIELMLHARADGTVSAVEILSAPTPDLGAEMVRSAHQWLFYPTVRDGISVPTKRAVKITVNVIKPR